MAVEGVPTAASIKVKVRFPERTFDCASEVISHSTQSCGGKTPRVDLVISVELQSGADENVTPD